jgi:Protein of unknown function (DUF2795)
MQTNAEPKEFLHAIHGLDFPASRIQIVNAAKDTGGTNGEVIIVLEHLPERMYATAKDLTDEIQRTYEATSSSSDVQSAVGPA